MSTTEPQLPATFCWSRMGAEAGEALPAILRRKEWERSLSRGRFYWGIGHSLSDSAAYATGDGSPLLAIFSPMKSKAQRQDASPDALYLWRSFIDARGTHPLPPHVFVTSRASTQSRAVKSRQYALVCTSPRRLETTASPLTVPFNALLNVRTGKPLDPRQVTAVVSYKAGRKSAQGNHYAISFAAHLKAPYCVRLDDPIELTPSDVDQIDATSRTGNRAAWAALVKRLRAR